MTASLIKSTVQFAPGQDAVVVRAPVAADPNEILAALEIGEAAPVLVICGDPIGPDGQEASAAMTVVGEAVAAAAGHTDAIVLDGATNSGVNLQVGSARAESPRPFRALIGVAPAGLLQDRGEGAGSHDGAGRPRLGGATVEPHHTHLVLADTDRWGGETPLLHALADSLANGFPVVGLVAGGGDAAISQAVAAVGRGWPVIVVSGTGGAAGRIAAATPRGGRAKDATLQAILSSGRVDLVSGTDATELTRRLTWALDGDVVLKDAWKLLATYDQAAVRLRSTFERLQGSILGIGVLATLLALLHQELGTQALRWAVIATSITVSALIALTGRRATGKRWVVTRAAAESARSEIFRYRTRTGTYADARLPGGDRARRPEMLASRLERIQTRLMHSEASSGATPPYEGRLPPDGGALGDDGLGPLEPAQYLELRVGDQIRYYERRLRELVRRRTVLQTIAVVASATGALVAAAGAETWVALTTALGAAPLAYLAQLQVDTTIVAYNQSAARLEGILRRWHGHPPEARTPHAFGDLVNETEAVMTTEHGGWVEQMSEALRELQNRQRKQRTTPD